MKYILLILAALLLCGCENPTESTINSTTTDMVPFEDVVHFIYNKHEYIKFKEGLGRSATTGVVHNPDCKFCNKNN